MQRDWFENVDATGLLASSIWSECEGRIEAFEKAWREQQAPAIEDYLCASGPTRRALLIELVSLDLEFRLKAGEAARVESYLGTYPELAGDPGFVEELIAAEYELRQPG
jgi:hypothetical protein